MTRRVALAAASAVVAVNIWTGAPLLALWVGSKMVRQTTLSMSGVVIVVAVLATIVFSMTVLLSWLNRAYLDLLQATDPTGRSQQMDDLDEPEDGTGRWAGFTPVERVVVASVYIAVATLLIWFFFIAGSPLPQ